MLSLQPRSMVEDMRKTVEGIFKLDALYKNPERAIFINQSFSGAGFRRVEASQFRLAQSAIKCIAPLVERGCATAPTIAAWEYCRWGILIKIFCLS